MAIIVKINGVDEFAAEFAQWPQRRSHFSRPALRALYEYLDEASNGMGEDIELDVVGLCCAFAEYKDMEAVKEDYESCNIIPNLIKNLSDLQDQTTVIEFDGGLLVHEF
jgi:hypothetical protein